MIPKIIWQTYESEYSELEINPQKCINSWKKNNPDWEYRYVSARERDKFVLDNFGKEWHTIYNSYKINILRSDLWRYMCLYINGGLYSDLDMLCKKPINYWLDNNLDFVVSEEPEEPGLTQSIFASSAKNIILKNLLSDIKEQFYLKNKYSNVVDYEINETGYVIFTKSINNTFNSGIVDKNNFMLYDKNKSKKIHYDSIEHFYAGNGNVFGPNYISWKMESLI